MRVCDNRRVLLSEATNEAARFMRLSRPAVTEQMLVISCERCGESFAADEIAVAHTDRRFVYRCPNDGLDLIRVGVGVIGRGGGDVEFAHGSVQIRLSTEGIDWSEFLKRDDPS
jgi:hypothetical protein